MPISTLRYYDEVGLLQPAVIDGGSGYRFYTLEQLPLLNRILALKWLGLSLDQIAHLLTEEVSTPHIRSMLLLKRLDLQQQVREAEERLSRVETRLQMLEQEKDMLYDVVLQTDSRHPFLIPTQYIAIKMRHSSHIHCFLSSQSLSEGVLLSQ